MDWQNGATYLCLGAWNALTDVYINVGLLFSSVVGTSRLEKALLAPNYLRCRYSTYLYSANLRIIGNVGVHSNSLNASEPIPGDRRGRLRTQEKENVPKAVF